MAAPTDASRAKAQSTAEASSHASIRLTEHAIAIDDLLSGVADPAAGAVVLFIGTTRNHNEGRNVARLEYEAYAGMAEKELEKIAADARSRWQIARIAIVHRTGVVPIGSASVAIAVSAAHRGDAFDAARYAIDTLKEVVPIWKKEFFEGGAIWIGDQAGRTGTWQTSSVAVGDGEQDPGSAGGNSRRGASAAVEAAPTARSAGRDR